MTPALVSCYFGDPSWQRLAAVLRVTAAQHCPDWRHEITVLAPPVPRQGARRADAANTQKLEHWARRVEAAVDGEELLFIDTDTAIVRPLDAIWTRSFDMAYTTKPVRKTGEFPFNAGVVFLRVNPITRWFMSLWATENQRLYLNKVDHTALRVKYGGMNQAALGSLIEQRAFQASAMEVLELPCAEWNCEDVNWATFDPDITRILHVKSSLRTAVIGPPTMPDQKTQRAAAYWKALDKEARRVLEARAS